MTPPPPPGVTPPTSGDYLFEINGSPSLYVSTIDKSSGALSSPTVAGAPVFIINGALPGLAVTPSNQFAYVFDETFSQIRGFSLLGPGLSLKELPDSPFSTSGASPNSLTLDPSGKFLYVVQSGAGPAKIAVFTVAPTGDLTSVSAVTETADLRQAVMDPTGTFLFANDYTGGRIFAYRRDGSTGSLSAVAGSPFAVPSNGQAIHELMDSAGKFLFVAVNTSGSLLNAGGIAVFTIDGSTGALTSISGALFPTSQEPSDIAMTPSGNLFYASNFSNGSIDGFVVDRNSGALSSVIGSPFSSAASPSSIAVDPSGNFLYVSIYPNSTIYGFKIDPSTGGLSALTGSPFPAASNPTNLMSLRTP